MMVRAYHSLRPDVGWLRSMLKVVKVLPSNWELFVSVNMIRQKFLFGRTRDVKFNRSIFCDPRSWFFVSTS